MQPGWEKKTKKNGKKHMGDPMMRTSTVYKFHGANLLVRARRTLGASEQRRTDYHHLILGQLHKKYSSSSVARSVVFLPCSGLSGAHVGKTCRRKSARMYQRVLLFLWSVRCPRALCVHGLGCLCSSCQTDRTESSQQPDASAHASRLEHFQLAQADRLVEDPLERYAVVLFPLLRS